jgi:hypothetical protein
MIMKERAAETAGMEDCQVGRLAVSKDDRDEYSFDDWFNYFLNH